MKVKPYLARAVSAVTRPESRLAQVLVWLAPLLVVAVLTLDLILDEWIIGRYPWPATVVVAVAGGCTIGGMVVQRRMLRLAQQGWAEAQAALFEQTHAAHSAQWGLLRMQALQLGLTDAAGATAVGGTGGIVVVAQGGEGGIGFGAAGGSGAAATYTQDGTRVAIGRGGGGSGPQPPCEHCGAYGGGGHGGGCPNAGGGAG